MPGQWTKDTVEFLFEYRERNGTLTAGLFLNQRLTTTWTDWNNYGSTGRGSATFCRIPFAADVTAGFSKSWKQTFGHSHSVRG
jgi:hypothetical protein